jgi:hypothetical protein
MSNNKATFDAYLALPQFFIALHPDWGTPLFVASQGPHLRQTGLWPTSSLGRRSPLKPVVPNPKKVGPMKPLQGIHPSRGEVQGGG